MSSLRFKVFFHFFCRDSVFLIPSPVAFCYIAISSSALRSQPINNAPSWFQVISTQFFVPSDWIKIARKNHIEMSTGCAFLRNPIPSSHRDLISKDLGFFLCNCWKATFCWGVKNEIRFHWNHCRSRRVLANWE